MDSSDGPIARSSTLIEQTGIPRKVLSRLLSATKIGVGFRVLDVGCGRGELAAYLNSLGILYVGMDESAANVIAARRAVPECAFHCTSMTDPGPRGGFDLVVVREASVLKASLLSHAMFSRSLQLLARVRPGGCLAFAARIGAAGSTTDGHQLSCYARHLGPLPGSIDLHELADGLSFTRSFRSRPVGQNGTAYGIAVLRLPPQPLSQDEWKQAAQLAAPVTAPVAIPIAAASATAGAFGPCCQWATRAADVAGYRSKAA